MPLLRRIGQALLYLFKEPRYEYELDDDAFYQVHYGNTTIPKDIPIRVRKVLVEQVGLWRWVKPDDFAYYDDIDFVDVMDEIADEFGIAIPDADLAQLDGTFDSIVRYFAGRIGQT